MKVKSVNTVILLCIGSIVLVTFLVGISWISSSTYNAIIDTQTKSMENMCSISLAALEEYIQQTESMAVQLSNQEVIKQGLLLKDNSEVNSIFKSVMENFSGYWAAFVFDTNGNILSGFNANGDDMSGSDRSSREYVSRILDGQDEYVSDEILLSKSGGGILIFAVAASVKDENGNIIGGIGLFPRWEGYTSVFIDPFRIGKNGYGYMLDKKGQIIAHAVNKDLYLQDLSKHGFVQTILASKDGVARYEWEGKEKIMSFKTMDKTGWSIVMSAYEDDLAETAIAQRNVLAISGVIVAIIMTLIMMLILRKIILRPVYSILKFSSSIAKGDLRSELTGKHHFELKALSDQIKLMVAELKNQLGFSDGVLQGLTLPCAITGPDFCMLWSNEHMCKMLEKDGSPELYRGIKSGEFFYGDPERETLAAKAIKEKKRLDKNTIYVSPSGVEKNVFITTTPFVDMDGALLGSISIWIDETEIREQQRKIEEQNQKIAIAAKEANGISLNLSTASEELAAQVEEASRGAEIQRDRAAETATAMEEMNSTVLEVAQNASSAANDTDTAKMRAQQGFDTVEEVIQSVGEVQENARQLKASMEELGSQAEGIGNILNVITDIADQTNLLALNAAIEAARAGDAGRGFAVVADEVRKLAEKTMEATKEVGGAITSIQSMTNSNVTATENAVLNIEETTKAAQHSGKVLQEIVMLVEKAADQVRGIATAAEEQSATSEEISRATEEINRISSETSQVMIESSKAVQEVATMSLQLKDVIENIQE